MLKVIIDEIIKFPANVAHCFNYAALSLGADQIKYSRFYKKSLLGPIISGKLIYEIIYFFNVDMGKFSFEKLFFFCAASYFFLFSNDVQSDKNIEDKEKTLSGYIYLFIILLIPLAILFLFLTDPPEFPSVKVYIFTILTITESIFFIIIIRNFISKKIEYLKGDFEFFIGITTVCLLGLSNHFLDYAGVYYYYREYLLVLRVSYPFSDYSINYWEYYLGKVVKRV